MHTCLPKHSGHQTLPICPVLVCFGAFEDANGDWCVRLMQKQISLALRGRWGRLVWDSLSQLCDGQTSWAMVLDKYRQSPVSEVPPAAFESLMVSLADEGVLLDAAHILPNLSGLGWSQSVWGIQPPPSDWPTRMLLPAQPAQPLDMSCEKIVSHSADLQAWARLSSARRSTRHFGKRALSNPQWQQLLQCYAAVKHDPAQPPNLGWSRRRVASAGALYRLKIWVVLLKPPSLDMPPGLYEVQYADDGSVDWICQADWHRDFAHALGQLARACSDPLTLQTASAWLLVTADLKAIAGKYRNMALSHALLESGAVLQNLDLIAAGLGLGIHWRAGMDTERIQALCKLPESQQVLASAVLGTMPLAQEPAPPAWLKVAWGEGMRELPHDVAMSQVVASTERTYNCYGRSSDPLLACDKALSEAVERYAMVNGPVGTHACWGDLPNMVHPHSMLRQMEEVFEPNLPHVWVPFVNLQNGQTAWLQKRLVFHTPESSNHRLVNSSGMACGPDPEEVRSWAALELFERDAFMRAWMLRQAGSPLPMTVLSPPYQGLVAQWLTQGCTVFIGQLQSAWAAVVMVFVQHPSQGWTRMTAASGWTLDGVPDKALSEIAASVIASLRGLKTPALKLDEVKEPLDHIHYYLQAQNFQAADFLVDPQLVPLGDLRTSYSSDWVTRLNEAGLQAFACDVEVPAHVHYWNGQRPHVTRVVIPGLLPIVFGRVHLPCPDPVWPFDQSTPAWFEHSVVHPFP